ncbi:hypothetical protein CFU_2974 [Collimonas fungivorans Ter331]|uniref:Uncharacterized protein n=1 Tax=Collimonas fungivorans (strain Ter331) TaxID=1005048 RepID=G0ACK4_COLFT|nr:hypothetical protein CFU_2974 [Collimonas fungivorans Ter331]
MAINRLSICGCWKLSERVLKRWESGALAVLVLGRTRPDLPRAFRCPGGAFVPLAVIGFACS